ncbi:MAG: hypothetical protein NTY71_04080 [Methanoregula sp.]|nr:hypothetical protein [Methanoregula sp.]
MTRHRYKNQRRREPRKKQNHYTEDLEEPTSLKSIAYIFGVIVKTIFKVIIWIIKLLGEFFADVLKDLRQAQDQKSRIKFQVEPRVIQPPSGTIIVIDGNRVISNKNMTPKVDRRTATEIALGGRFEGAQQDDDRSATEIVLGGSFGDKPRKGNKTASQKVLGGKYLR